MENHPSPDTLAPKYRRIVPKPSGDAFSEQGKI